MDRDFLRSLVHACLPLFAVAITGTASAHAQVADAVAPLGDTIADLQRFREAIDYEKGVLSADKSPRWDFSASIFGGYEHSTNALSDANLDFEGGAEPVPDEIGTLALAASAGMLVGRRDSFSVSGSVGRQAFADHGALDRSFGSAGLYWDSLRIPGMLSTLSYNCSSEFDDGDIRSGCGPQLLLSNPPPLRSSFVSWQLGVTARSGRGERFEDFVTAQAGLTGVTDFGAITGYAGIRYEHRRFNGGYGVELGLDDREDHRVSIPFGLSLNVRPELAVGLGVTATANWSNYYEYRYWDVTVGPTVRWRIF